MTVITGFTQECDELLNIVERDCPQLKLRVEGLRSLYFDERRARIDAEWRERYARDELRKAQRQIGKLESGRKNVATPTIVDEDGEMECSCWTTIEDWWAYCPSCGGWIDRDAATPPEPDYDSMRDALIEDAWAKEGK